MNKVWKDIGILPKALISSWGLVVLLCIIWTGTAAGISYFFHTDYAITYMIVGISVLFLLIGVIIWMFETERL